MFFYGYVFASVTTDTSPKKLVLDFGHFVLDFGDFVLDACNRLA
jgi:hypothetical protein